MQDQSEQDLITLIEVVLIGDQWAPTGRQILMARDAPLFEDPEWGRILETGSAAIHDQEFQQLWDIVKEAMSDT